MKDNIKLSIFWVFSFLVIILLMTFKVYAAEPYFPMQQNENGNIPEYIIDYFNDNYSEDYYIVVRWWGHNASFNEDYIYFIMFPKTNDFMLYGEISNNGYQFSLYNSGNQIGGLSNGYLGFRNGLQSDYWNGGQNISGWQSLNSSLYDSGTDFVSNFKIWTSNNEDNRSVVLKYGSDDLPIGQGHAIPPEPFESPTLATGSNYTLPREVPESPTIINYSWTTYNSPSIDNSTVESLLDSLIDVVKYNSGYFTTNISNEFDNLLNNIKGYFDYVSKTIQYYGGLIISNIQNGIQNLYDNMAALVQPIFEKIAYLTTPLEATVIWDNISTTSLVTNVNSIKTSLTSFQGAFTGVNEPNEYKIPIHLENLPSSWFGTQTTQYIDLGIINGTVKDGLRLFVWAMVTYGLVVTIFDSIANYINGGGDES